MALAGNISKKLAVLDVIYEKKDILFGSPVNKKDVDVAWLEVLAKAQSVSLASQSRKPVFAKSLFNLWKSKTLAKWNNGKKTKANLDAVDEMILNILETERLPPVNVKEIAPKADSTLSPCKISTPRKRPTTRSINTSQDIKPFKFETISPSNVLDDINNEHFNSTALSIKSEKVDITISPTYRLRNKKRVRSDEIDCANNLQNIKRFKFESISPASSLNNSRTVQFESSSQIDAAYTLHDNNQTQMHPRDCAYTLQNINRAHYDLYEMDVYIRRLQIVKLENELHLNHLEYTQGTSNEEVEFYYRRLQILKLERDLCLPSSKYTENFIE